MKLLQFYLVCMIGLSSSYFAFQGKGIYDSAREVFGMGFEAVELGAAHEPEPSVWETVKRIKHDFPEKRFTLHGVFPPPAQRTWFNASLGLTGENLGIVEGFFRAAQIVEAETVSIHPGFREELFWQEHSEPMSHPSRQKPIPRERAWAGAAEVFGKCLDLASEAGCDFAIENIPDAAIPLVYSVEDFKKMFRLFPGLKMMLDFGHALYDRLLPDFLEHFHGKIGQIHLHYSRPEGIAPKIDEHLPITSLEQLMPLKKVRQLSQIPVIFEHLPKTTRAEILAEKRLLEEFEKTL